MRFDIMQCKCDTCGGDLFPIEQKSVEFTLMGVKAIYKMECEDCKKQMDGEFYYPLDKKFFVKIL